MYSHPVSVCDGSDVSAVDKEKDGSKYAALGDTTIIDAVSYTHLTLPTIYSV